MREKQLIEAPVNGGRNYKVDQCSYVKKLGYMLETPVYLQILIFTIIVKEVKILKCGQSAGKVFRFILKKSSETIRQAPKI